LTCQLFPHSIFANDRPNHIKRTAVHRFNLLEPA
jgi:hypothetical protein